MIVIALGEFSIGELPVVDKLPKLFLVTKTFFSFSALATGIIGFLTAVTSTFLPAPVVDILDTLLTLLATEVGLLTAAAGLNLFGSATGTGGLLIDLATLVVLPVDGLLGLTGEGRGEVLEAGPLVAVEVLTLNPEVEVVLAALVLLLLETAVFAVLKVAVAPPSLVTDVVDTVEAFDIGLLEP